MSARDELLAGLVELQRQRNDHLLTFDERARGTTDWILGPGRELVLAALSSTPPAVTADHPQIPDLRSLAQDVSSLALLLAKKFPANSHELAELDRINRRWWS